LRRVTSKLRKREIPTPPTPPIKKGMSATRFLGKCGKRAAQHHHHHQGFNHFTLLCAGARTSGIVSTSSNRSYHKNVVDHYEKPRNVGAFDKKDANVGTGLVGAPACGDVMKLQIRVDDDGNITDSCFKTFGCGSAIASSSVATEWVKGQHVDEATQIKNSEIANHLNLPPVKLHCSMLAEDAIKAAVKDVKDKQAKAKEAAAGK